MHKKNNILKLALALSQKVLYPSSLERQNVMVALRLFDERNVYACEEYAPENYSGTAEFLKIMSTWWNIVNVRAPKSVVLKRDPFQDPIRSADDKNLKHLQKFSDWLKSWHSCTIGQ